MAGFIKDDVREKIINALELNEKFVQLDKSRLLTNQEAVQLLEIDDMLINNLEKELAELKEKTQPQRPINTDWIYCPVCKKPFVLWGEQKFCSECGTKIDWKIEGE